MESLSPGSSVGAFRLGERVGNTVWQAEDTRNGKRVAVKLLTRQLPKDPQRREAMVHDVRQNAALYHVNLMPIVEVAVAGDTLLLVMEYVDGSPVTKRYTSKPADRAEFFRVAYQAIDALKLLHGKNVTHANLNGDSILVTPAGQVRIGGLNLSNLLPKKDGPAATYQQKGTDLRCVSYMAPEQIANQPLTPQTDIWSLGVALYEIATGRLPYVGTSAPEIARKIVEESPASPKATNPDIDVAVLSVMGRCLFKDPFKRHKDAKSMLDDVTKADPAAQTFANDLARSAVPPAAAAAAATTNTRNAILFLADVANYDELHASDPAAAAKAAARMQQVLGEAAYLFDGQVLDPFAPRLIAEMPSIENALEAARKGEFDFSAEQQDGDALPVRLLLHAGEVATHDGSVVGDTITKGFEVLAQLPPQRLFLTEEFAKPARGKVRLRDAAARAGVKLYEIVAEPKVELPPEPNTAEIAAEDAAEAEELATIEAARKKQAAAKQKRVLGIAAGVVVLAGASAYVALSHKASTEPVKAVTRKSTELPPASAATPRKVYLPPFGVEGADPTLAPRANAIRLASIEVLRAFPEIRITDATAPDVMAVASSLRTGATGPELSLPGGIIPVTDVASGVQPVVQFVTSKLNLPVRISTTAEAMNAFGDAVSAVENAKIDTALRATLKADPKFLPAQLMAMRFFASEGKNADAIEAAKQVVTLDPSNLDAAHTVVTASLAAGDLPTAFSAYSVILKKDPKNIEALNTLGRYALAAGDVQRFGTCLARVKPDRAVIYEPDVLLAAGRIDAAADKYYDVKVKAPGNVALSLKIGRLSVLRHGMQIAEDELKNQQAGDPKYGAHILQAYLFAQSQNRAAALKEMEAAKAASQPGDEYYTYLAEVCALGGDPKATVDALENAANRKEPTASYVLSNPLFTFLQSDARFNKVRERMTAGQGEIRAALAGVSF